MNPLISFEQKSLMNPLNDNSAIVKMYAYEHLCIFCRVMGLKLDKNSNYGRPINMLFSCLFSKHV